MQLNVWHLRFSNARSSHCMTESVVYYKAMMLETERDALHPCPASEPVCHAHDLLCRQRTCRRRKEDSPIQLGTIGAVSQEERVCPDARGGLMTEQIAP